MDTKIIGAVFLFVAALIAAPAFNQANILDVPDRFTDNFEDPWSNNGTLTGLETDAQGNLQVTDTSGTYLSDVFVKGELLRMERAVIDADISDGSTLTVWETVDGGRINSENYTLQDGEYTYDLTDLNQTATGYQFQLTLQNNDEVQSVSMTGTVDQAEGFDDQFGTIIFFVAILLAFLMILPSNNSYGGRS